MKPKEYIGKFLWMFLPLVLFFAGQKLADNMTEEVVELLYEAEKRVVSGVTSVYIKVENEKDSITIDKFSISAPGKSVIVSAISELVGTNAKNWKGSLKPGQTIQAIFVVEDDLPIDGSYLSGLIKGEYQSRNESGDSVVKQADLTKKGVVSINKDLQYGFWLFLPLLVAGILYYAYIKWFSKDEPSEEQSGSSGQQA